MATQTDELALLVDAIQDYALILLGPGGEIRAWNRGAERVFGYSAAEVIGTPFSRFYTERDLAEKKPERELSTALKEGRFEDEGWRLRKDGTPFWANTIITPLSNGIASQRGFAKITRDLTERREAEERVRQSQEMFRLLVASVQEYAIFMLDPSGHVMTWNLGAERIKQYRPEEIIGKHFSIFYSAEDIESGKPKRELDIATSQGKVEDEGWRLRKDGTRFWANVVITAVFDQTGTLRGFAKVTRDMTARRAAEETQRALLEQREARLQAEEQERSAEASYRAAQEANRAKDEFMMTLSHELRTPLTAIVGWARMLPSMNYGDPMFREAIKAISRSADLQAKLIDDVLDISRIVSGKLRLTLENVEVNTVLKEALDAVRPGADAKHVTVATEFAPDLGTATLDPTRLQQIVWNLLSNAVKFTPKGGRVQLSAWRTASEIQISVTDTGEGIEPQFLPHVFEAFRQAETPSTRVHGGLGLGLSIVRYMTEAHGGNVAAESGGRGKGATFMITLPVRALRSDQVGDGEQEDRRRLANLGGKSILIVEDDPAGRELLVAALRSAGASVTAVDSASAALEHVEHHRPDLILTDIAMPMMDGYALQRQLRARRHLVNTPIVALTAFPASAVSGPEAEFNTYLRKPIDPYELGNVEPAPPVRVAL